jgi:AcrR family transcriptional regulator
VPKQTFFNLPDEKRDLLIETALEEFAARNYSSASISKIVARAGIAKGSLYQYFEDKQDFYLYLVRFAGQTLLEHIGQTQPPEEGADFFRLLRWQMTASVDAALKHPLHSQLIRRAYSSSLPFRDQLLDYGRDVQGAHFRSLVQDAQKKGQLNPDVDPDVAVFMLQAVMDAVGPFLEAKLGQGQGDWLEDPRVEKVFDQVIEILRDGLAK